jgi:hypothetical protein
VQERERWEGIKREGVVGRERGGRACLWWKGCTWWEHIRGGEEGRKEMVFKSCQSEKCIRFVREACVYHWNVEEGIEEGGTKGL